MAWLEKFVAESNRIEGYNRAPYQKELEAHTTLLELPVIGIPDLEKFVSTVSTGRLRHYVGMDVQVGSHVPMRGGPKIVSELLLLLYDINHQLVDPYEGHLLYENLHPFTDGNGRSGRALWLWSMQKYNKLHLAMNLGFLHNFYYQTLESWGNEYNREPIE